LVSLLVKTVHVNTDKSNAEMKSKSNVNEYKAMPKSIKEKLLDTKAGAVRAAGGADTGAKDSGVKGTAVKDTAIKDNGVVKDVDALVVRVDNNSRFELVFCLFLIAFLQLTCSSRPLNRRVFRRRASAFRRRD